MCLYFWVCQPSCPGLCQKASGVKTLASSCSCRFWVGPFLMTLQVESQNRASVPGAQQIRSECPEAGASICRSQLFDASFPPASFVSTSWLVCLDEAGWSTSVSGFVPSQLTSMLGIYKIRSSSGFPCLLNKKEYSSFLAQLSEFVSRSA